MEKDGEHVNIHEGFSCGTILTSIVRDGEYRRVRNIHRKPNTWYHNDWQKKPAHCTKKAGTPP